ncbi:MAG: adenosylcobinamide-GDP ribazoletransferase, partial [Actinomycetota bacterium]
RAEGLGSSYTAHVPRLGVAAGATLVAVGAVGAGPATTVGLVAAGVAAVGVATLARRAFGGTTGDVLGAVEQVGELAVLAAAARLVAEHGWGWG